MTSGTVTVGRRPRPRSRPSRRKETIDVWKEVVDVQQHFNDVSMRIRGMFVPILLALFASIGFLVDRRFTLDAWNVHVQYATLVPLFGILGTFLFYFIDRYWYHRLLVGSVKHGIKIEKDHEKDLPEISLSRAIGAESPYQPGRVVGLLARVVVRDEKFKKTGMLHSDGKLELFYKSVVIVLALASVLLALTGGIRLR